MLVLIVHSDPTTLNNLEKVISESGHVAVVTNDVQSAIEFLELAKVDAFLLEDHLPDGEGAEISESQKNPISKSYLPAIFTHGTNSGWPEQYSTYSSGRIEFSRGGMVAALSKSSITAPPMHLSCGPLSIDLKGDVWVDGVPTKFSDREKRILISLALHQGQPMSSTRILSDIWGQQHDPNTNIVAVYIKNIRAKLHPHKIIKTIRGIGYLMEESLTNSQD